MSEPTVSLLADGNRLLKRYLLAWKTRDEKILATIFHPTALYYTSPTKDPLRGLTEIEEYWRTKVHSQSRLQVRVTARKHLEGQFVFLWHAEFEMKKALESVTLDGVMWWRIRKGKITRLMEYYSKQTTSL